MNWHILLGSTLLAGVALLIPTWAVFGSNYRTPMAVDYGTPRTPAGQGQP